MNYGSTQKKVIFEDTDQRYAQLRVRLRHDGLTQAQFFQSIVTGYLNKNDDLMKFVSKVQESESKHGKRRLRDNKSLLTRGRDVEADFSLSSEDREKLFDLIADEVGDL